MWYECSGCQQVPVLDGVGWIMTRVMDSNFRNYLLDTYCPERIRKFQLMDIYTRDDYNTYGLCCGFVKEEMRELVLYVKQNVNNLDYLTGYALMVLSNCECIQDYVIHGPLAVFVEAYRRQEFFLDNLKPEVLAKLKLIVETGMQATCRVVKKMGIKRTCHKDAWVRALLDRRVVCDDETELRTNFYAYQKTMERVIGISAKMALARRLVATVCLIKQRRRS